MQEHLLAVCCRSTISVLLATVCLCHGATTFAEATDAQQEARERFGRGVELYSAGMHEAALAEFLRAYEVSPNYLVLFNIGQVHAQLRRFPEALAAFERYLSDGGTRVPAEDRASVESEIARLRLLVGRVTVEVEGPEGALIYVNDTEVGTTPWRAPLVLSSGTHRVEVRAEGFLPAGREVTVAGGEELRVTLTMIRTPEPAPAMGSIAVESNVPHATVRVDHTVVGQTPLTEALTVSPGRHSVEVERPGYEPYGTLLEVGEGEIERVSVSLFPQRDLEPHEGCALTVAASEDRSEVVLDGRPLVSESLVPPGPHLLEVRSPGFETWSQEVDLDAGGALVVEAVLRPTDVFLASYLSRARRFRVAAWVLVGTALATVGTGLGFFFWNVGREDDWRAERSYLNEQLGVPQSMRDDPETMTDDYIATRHDELGDNIMGLDPWNYVEWALFGTGIAAAIASVVLFVVGPNPRRYQNLSFRPQPGGVTLALSWP